MCRTFGACKNIISGRTRLKHSFLVLNSLHACKSCNAGFLPRVDGTDAWLRRHHAGQHLAAGGHQRAL